MKDNAPKHFNFFLFIFFCASTALITSCFSNNETSDVSAEGSKEAAEMSDEGEEGISLEEKAIIQQAAPTSPSVDGEPTPIDAPATSQTPSMPAPTEAVGGGPEAPQADAAAISSGGAGSGSENAVVRYVKTKKCAVLDAPNGKAVHHLSKGDHILVTIDGAWARTAEGQYIAAKHLTAQGVGRPRQPSRWRKAK